MYKVINYLRKAFINIYLFTRRLYLTSLEKCLGVPVVIIDLKDHKEHLMGYKPVDPEVDEAYRDFYTRLFENPDMEKLCKEYLPIIQNAVLDYFQRTADDKVVQKEIINNLTFAWKKILSIYPSWVGEDFWEIVLGMVKTWEGARAKRIHKGSIFYYWGGTAIKSGNLDEGFFLMHSAYYEDVLTYKSDRPNSSAYKFVSLDYVSKDFSFYEYIDSYKDFINQFLISYRIKFISDLTIDDFRRKFLDVIRDENFVFTFAHAVAKLRQLAGFSHEVGRSGFASIYELNLLFDLTLITDVAIQEKKKIGTYYHQLVALVAQDKKFGVSLTGNDLGEIMELAKAVGFDKTLEKLVFQNYKLSHGRNMSGLECDICISYLIRNHSGHNISSSSFISVFFEKIQQSVFNTLFLTVDLLYR